MALLPDWTIQARANHCDVTGRPFTEGETFYTLLYRDRHGGDAFSRRDVSAEGWKTIRANRDTPPPFCFWRAKYSPPPPPAPEALARADAETLLRRFLSENQPGQARATYILALMLERKRLLRPTESRTDEETKRRLLFYEHAKTGETFVVVDPGLRLDQIEDVQREVAGFLKG